MRNPIIQLQRRDDVLVGLLARGCALSEDRGRPRLVVRCGPAAWDTLAWLARAVPGSRLYGPYAKRDGRSNFQQWVVEGAVLVDELLPALAGLPDVNPARASALRAWCAAHRLESPC